MLDDPATTPGANHKTRIVLWNTTATAIGWPVDGKVGEHRVPVDVWRSLSSRNRQTGSLSSFRPQSASILLKERDAYADDLVFFATCVDCKHWAQAALPGYSQDRRSAIVHVDFGPTMHGSFVRYWFQKRGDQWSLTSSEVVVLN